MVKIAILLKHDHQAPLLIFNRMADCYKKLL